MAGYIITRDRLPVMLNDILYCYDTRMPETTRTHGYRVVGLEPPYEPFPASAELQDLAYLTGGRRIYRLTNDEARSWTHSRPSESDLDRHDSVDSVISAPSDYVEPEILAHYPQGVDRYPARAESGTPKIPLPDLYNPAAMHRALPRQARGGKRATSRKNSKKQTSKKRNSMKRTQKKRRLRSRKRFLES